MRERASFLECWAQRMFHDDDDCFGWFSGLCWWAYEKQTKKKKKKKERKKERELLLLLLLLLLQYEWEPFHAPSTLLSLSHRLISIFYLCLMSIYFWFSWEFFFLFFFASTFHHSLFPLSLATKTDKYA